MVKIGSHTWSPDAMEGPTLVSASIHAATMVIAGLFMIARCSPLFEYPPTALIVITFESRPSFLGGEGVSLWGRSSSIHVFFGILFL